jgi:hypothetical protein
MLLPLLLLPRLFLTSCSTCCCITCSNCCCSCCSRAGCTALLLLLLARVADGVMQCMQRCVQLSHLQCHIIATLTTLTTTASSSSTAVQRHVYSITRQRTLDPPPAPPAPATRKRHTTPAPAASCALLQFELLLALLLCCHLCHDLLVSAMPRGRHQQAQRGGRLQLQLLLLGRQCCGALLSCPEGWRVGGLPPDASRGLQEAPKALSAHAHGGMRRSALSKVLTHRQRQLLPLLLLLLCIQLIIIIALLTISICRLRPLGQLLLLHQLQVACCGPCSEPRLLLSLGLQQHTTNMQTGSGENQTTVEQVEHSLMQHAVPALCCTAASSHCSASDASPLHQASY